MDIQAMLSEMHQIYVDDPVRAVRGQAFIKILHAQIHADLTARLTRFSLDRHITTKDEATIFAHISQRM